MSTDQAAFLPEIVRRIVEGFAPEKIVLFGSLGRGEAGPDSDVDLLVILRRIARHHEARVAIRRALADLPVAKDIIVATPEEIERSERRIGSILWPAVQEGRTLYERTA